MTPVILIALTATPTNARITRLTRTSTNVKPAAPRRVQILSHMTQLYGRACGKPTAATR